MSRGVTGTILVFVLGSATLFQPPAEPAPSFSRIGVLPVLDQTDGVFHEVYGVNFRRLLVQELLEEGLQPIFINGGPSFDGADRDLAVELADEVDIDSLLSVRLSGVVEESRWKRLEDVQKRADSESERAEALEAVLPRNSNRDDLLRLAESGLGHLVVATSLAPSSNPEETWTFFTEAPIRRNFLKDMARIVGTRRKFTDTAAGRAAAKSAKRIAKVLVEKLEEKGWSPPQKKDRAEVAGRCEIVFGVRFLSKNRTSRSYTVAVNGQEATFRIRNGRLSMTVPKGYFHAAVTVQDGPYGMPLQDIYDANTFIGCRTGKSALFLEIGKLGEAVLRETGQ